MVDLWAVPIYHEKVDVKSYSSITQTHFIRTDNDDSWISEDTNILNNHKDLHDIIQTHINSYVHDKLGFDGTFVITTSWLNIHNPNDYAPSHYHKNSMFSGVLYLDVPEKSGGICFSRDISSYVNLIPTTISPTVKFWNEYNSQQYTLVVETGDIILFPSHISHQVLLNESNQDRISLAFNIFCKGEMGEKENRIKI